jgi:hypothetical protein
MKLTQPAKIFIGLMALGTLAILATSMNAAVHAQSWHPAAAFTLLAVALATSRMKVKLPGIAGNMSVNLPFLLLAVVMLNRVEAILIACAAAVAQTLPKAGTKFKPVQMFFNVCMMAVSAGAAGMVFRAPQFARPSWFALALPAAATVFFLGQTVPVSIVVALTDGGSLSRIWVSIGQLSFPYFVVSAGVTAMVTAIGNPAAWLAALLLSPVMYGIHRSYELYFAHVVESLSQPLARTAAAGA